MIRVRKFALAALMLTALDVALPSRADEPIDFQELFDVLKANLAGVKESELNQAAALGLVKQLGPQVSLVSGTSPGAGEPAFSLPFSACVLDGAFAYLRVGPIGPGVDKVFADSLEALRTTNRLKGLVLDLRFSGGHDYAAAFALANQFFGSEQPLVDWGEGLKKATDKANAVNVPVAVLLNQKTSGAAEVVAGILRQTDIALLIGTNTAGGASVAKEFPLKSGQRLRVAVAPIKVADGKVLPITGLKADIQVEVNPEFERVWYEDAYKTPGKSPRFASAGTNENSLASSNRIPRRRLNEAELVRMNRDGQNLDVEPPNNPARSYEPAPPVIGDPVLARALDLLKGIAVVTRFRPS